MCRPRGGVLGSYLRNESAAAFLAQMPEPPAPWKAADFPTVMVWKMPNGMGFIVLFDKDGCARLKAMAPYDAVNKLLLGTSASLSPAPPPPANPAARVPAEA